MLNSLLKGIIAKKLLVKKGSSVTGTVCVHFPTPKIQDIQLTDFSIVDVFGRIGMTPEDVKKSNISALVHKGDLVILE